MIETVLAWGMPGGWEWIVILLVALVIFGRRLPEVGRSLGRGLVEFKKGLKGVKDELDEVDRDVDDAVRRETEEEQEPKQLDASKQSGVGSTVKDKTKANA